MAMLSMSNHNPGAHHFGPLHAIAAQKKVTSCQLGREVGEMVNEIVQGR